MLTKSRIFIWVSAIVLTLAYMVGYLAHVSNQNYEFPKVAIESEPGFYIGRVSASPDENLIGTVYYKRNQIKIEIIDRAGQHIFGDSLARFNPHQVTGFNRIIFSPDSRQAVIAVNDIRNNLDSRLVLIDLERRQMIDLSSKDRLGPLAFCYDCQDGPVWLDNATLAYVHRLGNSAQELVFVDLATAKEVLPRKQFYYKPVMSNSKDTLVCHTTAQNGKTNVVLIGLSKNDGRWVTTGERILASGFRNASRFAWSPDDRHIAFSYMDEEADRKGINPVAVYDVATGKEIFKISDYVSSPQWLDNRLLLTGYWVATPFQGQNVHTFSGFLLFDVPKGEVTDFGIKSQNENVILLPAWGQVVMAEKDRLTFKVLDSAFSNISDYETRVSSIIEDSRKNAGITPDARPTSLDVRGWKTYHNDNFGVSFKYPSDWKFLVAAGDGYMNIILGKGTDGIEINLSSLPESPAAGQSFEEAFLAALAKKTWGYPTRDLVKVTINGREFFRATAEGIEESTLNLTYYLNAPVVGNAFPQLTDVMIFSLKSFTEAPQGAAFNAEENPSHQVLKTMLASVQLTARK